jgi:hypothetical protein
LKRKAALLLLTAIISLFVIKGVLQVLGKWLTVPDKVPNESVDIIFCHTYDIRKDKKELTDMCARCFNRGIELLNEGVAGILITSVEKHGAKLEKMYKRMRAEKTSIPKGKFRLLPKPITTTYDEVRQIKKIMADTGGESLLVVADKYHMKRVLDTFHRLMPDVEIYNISTETQRYEPHFHPNPLRLWHVGHKPTWILHNAIFYFLTPFFVKER